MTLQKSKNLSNNIEHINLLKYFKIKVASIH